MMSSNRHHDALDLDDDEDDDDDNDYAIYHYNHRYGSSQHHQGRGDDEEEDNTGFADFENTPTFDAAFADFPTDGNSTAAMGSFQANFDESMETFASFPDSNFSEQDWGTQPASLPTDTTGP
jgi:hypothetical protein